MKMGTLDRFLLFLSIRQYYCQHCFIAHYRPFGPLKLLLAPLVLALRRVEAVDRPQLLSSLRGVIAEMGAGEAIQLERRGRFEPDPAAYERANYMMMLQSWRSAYSQGR